MTQEEKDLLLKDLCARLPYGVKITCNKKNNYTAKGIDLIVTDEGDWEYAITAKGIKPVEIDFIKPYLFPLSSMTEEQTFDFDEVQIKNHKSTYPTLSECSAIIDWGYKHHFDVNNLIEKGLAIDATGKNIY